VLAPAPNTSLGVGAFAVQIVAHPLAGDGPTPHVGSSTMPRPASRTFAFKPEHIQAMRNAFDAVCTKLELSVGTGDQVTELVALRIIELARAGERDANRLIARTLAEFGVGSAANRNWLDQRGLGSTPMCCGRAMGPRNKANGSRLAQRRIPLPRPALPPVF